MKCILSSRPTLETSNAVELTKSGLQLDLGRAENAAQVAGAVDAFIDVKISKLASLHDDNIRLEARKLLRRKANGTFFWVALVAKEIEAVEDWEILETIEKVPSGLNELYDQVLTRLREHRLWENCRLLISTAAVAYRPLRTVELASISGLLESISSVPARVHRLLELCASFLTVQSDGTVHLIHQSAKDFLMDTAAKEIFPAGAAQTHRGIMNRSLELMKAVLRRDIYDLRQPGILSREITPPSPDPLQPIQYSCIYWIDHFCDSCGDSDLRGQHEAGCEPVGGSDSPWYLSWVDAFRGPSHASSVPTQKDIDCGPVREFLTSCYLYWLEALSLMGAMRSVVLSLTRLRVLIKVRPPLLSRIAYGEKKRNKRI